ncbi:hypothetical protein Y013_24940 (plasmid) [Rhodococcus pyridinivorans SB3094]|uniref:Uncharacterized protein n=1 Tax=Rhodococcus pyridinivorans SB3094 TaxID=1435356 RepID=V9XS64_9NOCA|nr:hypothetical protein [Rhodococcus pyridinivorans]AHD24242.1 hypothetical protein Y013_24940 [Rhodococcus pyridinivorans SB3094]
MTVMFLLFPGALLLLFGHLWSRSTTEAAPKVAALSIQACGALTIGVAALASAASWTAKLPVLLSSTILLAMCAYAYIRVRQTIQDPD